MTTTNTDWTAHAKRLADQLAESGDLTDPAWRAAISAVPRHLLVPRAYTQAHDGSWSEIDLSTPEGMQRVYSTTTLVTAIDGRGHPVSSSTKPDLMVRMLELLCFHYGDRVLEIGTGTGYNAGLLSQRLGEDNVFSIDVDPELVTLARQRLGGLGFLPRLAARDGVGGWPEHGPYDKIIATCSVPRIPQAWADQLAPDGRLLADLKIGLDAGNLVLLTKHGNRLKGSFTARWASFMPARHARDDGQAPARVERAEQERKFATTAPPEPWNTHREVWMLASPLLPPGTTYGYRLDPGTRTPTAATLTASDGSWCAVDLSKKRPRVVTEGGPTPLWESVERAYEQWYGLGEPPWAKFHLEVRPNGDHEITIADRPGWRLFLP
ncbi:methyltransferase domain-containing protein [Streptoalloteichus hindustanus]|uniref:Protein-L-isoaspartate O-methyltransferase n=1 Tax=Streptoalloteichus hindustanus TaxID=2017 RepID=A0A1M5DPK6_STRHI|nr:methyltransferase domain-containing protein [Streptoalloteichus hindustanus]SHF68836.1 Protein-L-isoaspartate O-methyltransferase [Streptoalloteichus hindustanus]